MDKVDVGWLWHRRLAHVKNYTLDEFLSDEGIKHQYSAPYTPQQNGVAERKKRRLSFSFSGEVFIESKASPNEWR